MEEKKQMVILRGLPGSGKSHIAAEYKKRGFFVCCTDDFFTVGGKYIFVKEKLNEYHAKTLRKASFLVRNGHNVVIDNCNSQLWELQPYVMIATQYAYSISIVIPSTPWSHDPVICAQKCTHAVPEKVIAGILSRWQDGTIDDILLAKKPEWIK